MINIILFFILVVFIIFVNLFIYLFVMNFINDNINEIYVINLKKRPERLELFKKNYKLIRDYKIIDAINGNELDKEYINTIIGTEAKKTLNDFYKYNIIRKYHYELSSYGAIGCYLTHINVWTEIIKSNKQNALIFEDDAKVSNINYFDLNKRLRLLPDDWDIYLLINPDFCYLKEPLKDNRNLFKVKRFFLLHAYIININGCKKIIENGKLFPINQQIDHHLSELALINKLNIYIHDKLPYYNTINQESDIQINSASTLSYERFVIR
jgi:GR25 family glycosyltransferase involved in LPS biosynthesis